MDHIPRAFDCDVRVYKYKERSIEKEFDYNAKLITFVVSGYSKQPIAIIKQTDGFVSWVPAELIRYM